jgi:hypothetical protein
MSTPAPALELRCPRCSTPARSGFGERSLTCAACGALVLFGWCGREAFFVQDAALTDERHLARALERTHPRGQPPRLLSALRIQAPYWQIWADLVQAAPGRAHAGLRPLHLRTAPLALGCPAYADVLHLARHEQILEASAALRPLEARDVPSLGPFLPWEPPPERARQKLEQLAAQPLGPEQLAVERLSLLVHTRRALVYRPHWLARVIGASGQGFALVDAVSGELLGRPGTLEARALQEALRADPQAFGSEEAVLTARDSSCPECGLRQRFSPQAHVQVCDGCGRGLALEATALRQTAYAHGYWGEPDPDGLWLPFWAFQLRLAPPSGEPVGTLEAWSQLAFPEGAPPGFEPRGGLLWLPAFRLLGRPDVGGLFRELIERLHQAPPQVEDGGFRPGGAAELVPASLSAAEARELGPLALLGVLSGAALARIGPSALRRALLAATLTLSRPRLTLVSFERRGDAAGLPGTSFALPRSCWQ